MLLKNIFTKEKIRLSISFLIVALTGTLLIGCGKEYKSGEAPYKQMSASEISDTYNKLYPKMKDFVKDNIEKEKTSDSEPVKIDEIRSTDPTIKGLKQPNNLDFSPSVLPNGYKFGFSIDGGYSGKDVDAQGIKSYLHMKVDKSKFDLKSFKVSGTLFEKYLNLVSTEKIDMNDLDSKLKEQLTGDSSFGGMYGCTHVNISYQDDCINCDIDIH